MPNEFKPNDPNFKPNDPNFKPNREPDEPERDEEADWKPEPVSRGEAAAALERAGAETARLVKNEAHVKMARLRALKRSIAVQLYEMGELLRDFFDRKLWAELDLKDDKGERRESYKSWKEFLDSEELVGPVRAHELISVVRAFPRETALELGMAKCYAIVMLARATPEDDTAMELLDRHPTLREVAVRDLEDRARRIRNNTGTIDDQPRDDADVARLLAVELQKLLVTRGASGATVTARLREGEWWLDVHLRASDVGLLREAR